LRLFVVSFEPDEEPWFPIDGIEKPRSPATAPAAPPYWLDILNSPPAVTSRRCGTRMIQSENPLSLFGIGARLLGPLALAEHWDLAAVGQNAVDVGLG
jgi:hypothetical protein